MFNCPPLSLHLISSKSPLHMVKQGLEVGHLDSVHMEMIINTSGFEEASL
jgi:hypothetical protein